MSEEAKLPWFKFEPQVWLSDKDVRKLTHAQRGIYMDLLSIDWISRGLPENPAEACNLLTGGAKVKDVTPVLALFKVQIAGGLVTHKRSERQRQEFAEKSDANRGAANARWKGKRSHANASGAHPSESFENGAPAMHPHSECNANALPTDMRNGCGDDAQGHAKDMPRALARDKDKEEDKDKKTSPEKSISLTKGPGKIDSRGGSSLSRPSSEAEAIKLCRAQMVSAPDDFIREMHAHLESVKWMSGNGVNQIESFTAYVRRAWISRKDDAARRSSGGPQGKSAGKPLTPPNHEAGF